jgi:hypothetical protein
MGKENISNFDLTTSQKAVGYLAKMDLSYSFKNIYFLAKPVFTRCLYLEDSPKGQIAREHLH